VNKNSKYNFGEYTGNNLRALVKKCTFEARNESFDKTQSLMDVALGIVCKLVANGHPLNVQQIMEIWKRVN
jgi:hypothetical protein